MTKSTPPKDGLDWQKIWDDANRYAEVYDPEFGSKAINEGISRIPTMDLDQIVSGMFGLADTGIKKLWNGAVGAVTGENPEAPNLPAPKPTVKPRGRA